MFSGLSNQVTSWMGSVKGEPQDEDVPTPTLQQTQKETEAQEPQSQQPPLEEIPIASEGGVEGGPNAQRFAI